MKARIKRIEQSPRARRWLDKVGVQEKSWSNKEMLIIVACCIYSVSLVYIISVQVMDSSAAVLIAASIGASALIMFSSPFAPVRPWPVVGGHVFSAAVGVTCYQQFGVNVISCAFSVGLAVALMHYLRCIHPPGGATALLTVIGGAPVHEMGYSFVLVPVFINALLLWFIAAKIKMAMTRYWRVSAATDQEHNMPTAVVCDACRNPVEDEAQAISSVR